MALQPFPSLMEVFQKRAAAWGIPLRAADGYSQNKIRKPGFISFISSP